MPTNYTTPHPPWDKPDRYRKSLADKYQEAVDRGEAAPFEAVAYPNNPCCGKCLGHYLHRQDSRTYGDGVVETLYVCTRCGNKKITKNNPTPAKEAKPMNQYTDTLNMLHLDKDVPTIAVDFTKNGQPYTYKCDPALHTQLKENDLVLLTVGDTDYSSTRPVFKIGVVAEVHTHSQIRFGNESRSYEWCVQKLNTDAAHAIKEQERKIVESLAHAQAKKQVREAMGEIPDEVWGLIEGGTPVDVIDTNVGEPDDSYGNVD